MLFSRHLSRRKAIHSPPSLDLWLLCQGNKMKDRSKNIRRKFSSPKAIHSPP